AWSDPFRDFPHPGLLLRHPVGERQATRGAQGARIERSAPRGWRRGRSDPQAGFPGQWRRRARRANRQRIDSHAVTPHTRTDRIEPTGMPDGAPPTNAPRLHVILLEPDIASNTGSIGRTCVAAGAALWLVRPLGFHLDDRHLRRAGLDYWEHLEWRVVDRLADGVTAPGREPLWSFSTKAARLFTDAGFPAGDGLVFGPETRGLPPQWISESADYALRIPIRPEARSL